MKTLKVEGMTCSHCVESVKRALTSSPGVKSASVDLRTGKAIVEGDDVDLKLLIGEIEKLGYKAHESD